MNKKILLAATLLISTTALNANAQVVPTSAESGRLTDRFTRDKIQSKSTNQIMIQDQQQQADIKGAEQIKMKLASINIEGNTKFSDAELAPIYEDKIGKNITLADLYAIRDAITKKYREAGYIISRAVVTEQDFNKNNARVNIRVIEGYVSSVSVQGDTKGNRKLIDTYVSKIKQDGALNSNNLERYLLLINDLPGTTATATLKPAASGTGGTDVVINLSHDLTDGIVSFDNSGTKFIGPYLMTAEGRLNSALGLSEEIKATLISDARVNELKFGQLEYKQPIGYEGTKIKFGAGVTEANPGSTVNQFGIKGVTTAYDMEITHPFIRTRKENLSARFGFAAKNTKTDATAGALYNDKVRVFTLGGTYDRADNWGGVNLIDLSINQGVDIFGATDSRDLRSRTNGDATFTKYNFEASRTQALIDTWSLYVAGAGQYSNEALLASEEFGFGGREFGRGYDFSEITGDSGLAGKIELQYGLNVQYRYLSDLQAYTFYDIGRIWQKEAFVTGEDDSTSAASAGIGLRFNVTKSIAGYVEGAKPLTKDLAAEGDKDVRLNFGISYLF